MIVIGFGLKIWIRQFHSLSIDTFAAGYSMLTTLPRFLEEYSSGFFDNPSILQLNYKPFDALLEFKKSKRQQSVA